MGIRITGLTWIMVYKLPAARLSCQGEKKMVVDATEGQQLNADLDTPSLSK